MQEQIGVFPILFIYILYIPILYFITTETSQKYIMQIFDYYNVKSILFFDQIIQKMI